MRESITASERKSTISRHENPGWKPGMKTDRPSEHVSDRDVDWPEEPEKGKTV